MPLDGSYTIRLSPFSDNTGSITLAILDVEESTHSVAMGGPPVTVDLFGFFDAEWLQFDAKQGDWIRLDAQTDHGDARCCGASLVILDSERETVRSEGYWLRDDLVRELAVVKTSLRLSASGAGDSYWFQVPSTGQYEIGVELPGAGYTGAVEPNAYVHARVTISLAVVDGPPELSR